VTVRLDFVLQGGWYALEQAGSTHDRHDDGIRMQIGYSGATAYRGVADAFAAGAIRRMRREIVPRVGVVA
jgi:hypothetical protein